MASMRTVQDMTSQWEHSWYLHLNNAPAHKALCDQKVIAKIELQWILNHPTALVSPCRLFLVLKIQG
jgi:hypothetical protein